MYKTNIENLCSMSIDKCKIICYSIGKLQSDNILYNMEVIEMENNYKGYDQESGLYTSRYYAKKDATGEEVVVKVDGGYKIMDASYYYNIWRKQK